MIPTHRLELATAIGLGLYTAYNLAATLASFPAGRLSDHLGQRGPMLVVTLGVMAFLASYVVFAVSPAMIVVLAVAFTLAGVGIGCVETAQTAAVASLAPESLRGRRSDYSPPSKRQATSSPVPSPDCSTP